MENFITQAVDIISSADVYLLAISGVIVALAAVAKLTKTTKDDEILAKAKAGLDKIISYLPSRREDSKRKTK